MENISDLDCGSDEFDRFEFEEQDYLREFFEDAEVLDLV